MNESNDAHRIDLKDLLCFCLKHLVAVILVGVVCAAGLVSYKYWKSSNTVTGDSSTGSVLDTSRRPGESDEEYSSRVMNINRAIAIMESISNMDGLADNVLRYFDESVFMSIDPNAVAHSEAQLSISLDVESAGDIGSLLTAYENAILHGEYLNDVAAEFGCDPLYISELIRLSSSIRPEDTNDTYVVYSYDSGANSAVLNVEVVGRTVEETDLILDSVLSEAEDLHDVLSGNIAGHSIEVAGRQSSVSHDEDVMFRQLEEGRYLADIYTWINNENTLLDNTAKQFGFADRSSFYQAPISSGNTASTMSMHSLIKYALFGFVIGAVLVFAYCVMRYVWGSKVYSRTQFAKVSRGANIIGVCKPSHGRISINPVLDRLTDDDNSLTSEINNKIIAANYAGVTEGAGKVLITGTADKDEASALLEKLGIDNKFVSFLSSEGIDKVAGCDGIVLIERRGVSDKRTVEKELDFFRNSGKEVLGVILI